MELPKGSQICREFQRCGFVGGRTVPDSFLSQQGVPGVLKSLSASLLPANFTPGKDVSCTQKLTNDELLRVVAALDALTLFQPFAEKVDKGTQTLRTLMLETWDSGVPQWLLFFYNAGKDLNDTIANRTRPFRFRPRDCTVVLFGSLKSITLCTPLCERLINTPDLLGVAGYLWVDNPKLPHPGLPADIVNDELTVAIQNIQLDDKTPQEDPTSSFSVVFSAAESHSNAKAVMITVTKHLERLIAPGEISTNTEELAKAADFIASMAKIPTLCAALHQVGLLVAVVKAIGALTNAFAENEGNVRRSKAIAKAVELLTGMVLIDHLLSGTGVKSLIQAVQAGLVKTLWDARWMFDDFEGCVSAITDVVKFGLGPSLIFRSVLHVVEEDINRSGMLRDMRDAAIDEADEAWCTFSDFYSDMLMYRDDDDEARENMNCARRECATRNSSEPVKLKRCTRCQYTRYCSPECQKAHWSSHKQWCKPEDFDNDIHPVSDRDFARNAAEWEAASRIDYIKKNMPPGEGDIFLIVDFTTMNKFIKIGFVPSRPVEPGHKRVLGIHARVQFGKKQIDTLGAVTSWTEFEENAGDGQRVWYKPGEDGTPIPKSMARAQEAKSALVISTSTGGSGSRKNKKKKSGKRK